MASVDISYNCGCGFTTKKLEEATAHCDTKYHDMSVHGFVKSSTRGHPSQAHVPPGQTGHKPQGNERAKTPKPTPQKPASAEPTITAANTADFDRLRSMLRHK